MTKRVRVIRILEYDYPDQETCERDMAAWYVPPNGVRDTGKQMNWLTNERRPGTMIRSATTFPQTLPHEDPESDDRQKVEGDDD